MLRSVLRWIGSALLGALIGVAVGAAVGLWFWRAPVPADAEHPQYDFAVLTTILFSVKLSAIGGGVAGLAFLGLRRRGTGRALAVTGACAAYAAAVAAGLVGTSLLFSIGIPAVR